ncbi:MAG TPA: hypothetical protein VFN78_13605 [Ktedonobacterales bacterium]|nr:hypothetical protein [Ktedonobacterales bacterium]
MAHAYSHDAHVAPDAQPTSQVQRLDLKALRLAVHGWWLGNPLVYKPGAADLAGVARELSGAGVASGVIILDDTPTDGDHSAEPHAGALSDAAAVPSDEAYEVHAVLILRPPAPMSHTPLGMAAAAVIAEVAEGSLGRPCSVQGRWQVILRESGGVASRLARVAVEQDEDVALLEMRLSLGRLWGATQDDASQPTTALFTRADWREVFLARALHTLDGRLRAVYVV